MILVYKNGNMIGGTFVSATRANTTFQPMVASDATIKLSNKDKDVTWTLTNNLKDAYAFVGAEYPTDEQLKAAADKKKRIDSVRKPKNWDVSIKKSWRDYGGDFHGPCVETATMPESSWLAFLWNQTVPSYLLAAAIQNAVADQLVEPKAAADLNQLIADLDLIVPKNPHEPKLQKVELDFYAKVVHKVTTDERNTFVRTAKGWEATSLADLKTGDVFSMFDPDGKPVFLHGSTLMVAVGEPFFDQSTSAGIWGITCDPYVDKE